MEQRPRTCACFFMRASLTDHPCLLRSYVRKASALCSSQHSSGLDQVALSRAAHRSAPPRQSPYEDSLQPVYRASPYTAEVLRAQQAATTAQILFVEDAGQCRAVLAASLFDALASQAGLQGLVRSDFASVGPPLAEGWHDPRVQSAADIAGLQLKPQHLRSFDEHVDIVHCDLVLVMDRPDLTDVLREVSVFDAINPEGGYSNRVRMLGAFQRYPGDLTAPAAVPQAEDAAAWALPLHAQRSASRSAAAWRSFNAAAAGAALAVAAPGGWQDEIADPLYFNRWDMREMEALAGTIEDLRTACRGLIRYLQQLRDRCAGSSLGLPEALALSLRSPMPSVDFSRKQASELITAPAQGGKRAPLWKEAGNLFTVRYDKSGRRCIVKKRSVPWAYWRSLDNVARELQRWMAEHPQMHQPGVFPSQGALRKSGAAALAVAIMQHGGTAAVASELDLGKPAKRPRGWWRQPGNLESELQEYIQPQPAKSSQADTAAAARAAGGLRHSDPAPAARRSGALSSSASAAAAQGFEGGGKGAMPTRKQLLDAGRADIVKAVTESGGFPAVAAELGLTYKARPRRTKACIT